MIGLDEHPALRPGATRDCRNVEVILQVSILTRSQGRVRLSMAFCTCAIWFVFQSSPGRKAGCDMLANSCTCNPRGFNPHPVARPGATYPPSLGAAPRRRFNPHPVARPGATQLPRRLRSRHRQRFNPHPVARPGATLPITYWQKCRPYSFNPHPVARPGATRTGQTAASLARRFNPHPVARPGATPDDRRWQLFPLVSILTRSQGRVRRPHDGSNDRGAMFQSSPGRKAGCDERRAGRDIEPCRVSILTRSQGRVRLHPGGDSFTTSRCFNPHPVARPGATIARSVPPIATLIMFQSSPGRKAGCD